MLTDYKLDDIVSISYVTAYNASSNLFERLYSHNEEENKRTVKEKDTDMLFRTDTNIEITQRNFILTSLQEAWYNENTLKKDFYLQDDDSPRTAKDLIKRIADGMYVLPVNEEEDNGDVYWDCPFSAIRWRDPAKKEDRVGYNKAREQREVAYAVAKATIVLKDIETGAKALEEFKNKKYN